MKILVIDGKGGKMGSLLIQQIKKKISDAEVTAVGTNAIATSAMAKAGADNCATGENPVVVASKSCDVIAGPLGIVIADALLGEVTPVMANAVASSRAARVLLPVNKCNNIIVGSTKATISEYIDMAIDEIQKFCI